MKIDHQNKRNVCLELDTYPNVYYMKKWWLEHIFTGKDGKKYKFRGWITTNALHKEDFPETLEGTFWVSKVKENGISSKGIIYTDGYFDIGFGEKGNFVISDGVFPFYDNIESHEQILETMKRALEYDRLEARIEDCLVLDKTYIEEIRT